MSEWENHIARCQTCTEDGPGCVDGEVILLLAARVTASIVEQTLLDTRCTGLVGAVEALERVVETYARQIDRLEQERAARWRPSAKLLRRVKRAVEGLASIADTVRVARRQAREAAWQ